jgi:glycerol uptake facilitator protein
LGLAAAGKFAWVDVPGYIIGQVLGGIFGGTLVWLQFLPHWKVTQDPSVKLGVFCTAPAIPSRFANLLSEVIGTFAFIFALSYLGVTEFSQGLNPLVIGGLIVLVGMSLGNTTGYAINPARDFGPRVTHFILPIKGKGHSNWSYSWIPIVGPLIGGILGATLYEALFNDHLLTGLYLSALATLAIIVLAINEQKS